MVQILILFVIYNITILLFNLPEFIRHQNEPTYKHYNSVGEYFMDNMLEGVITATAFSIIIPFLDKFLKKRFIKFGASSTL